MVKLFKLIHPRSSLFSHIIIQYSRLSVKAGESARRNMFSVYSSQCNFCKSSQLFVIILFNMYKTSIPLALLLSQLLLVLPFAFQILPLSKKLRRTWFVLGVEKIK